MNFCLAHAKIEALLKKKKIHSKMSLTLVLHQAIQLVRVIITIEFTCYLDWLLQKKHEILLVSTCKYLGPANLALCFYSVYTCILLQTNGYLTTILNVKK